jgi:hypothetical protein
MIHIHSLRLLIICGFDVCMYVCMYVCMQSPLSSNPALLIITFPYNGEPMALLHLKYLYHFVDMFVIIEARWTHSGRRKPYLYFYKNYHSFLPYAKKIHFLLIDSFPPMPKQYVLYLDYLYHYDLSIIVPPYESYYPGQRDFHSKRKVNLPSCISFLTVCFYVCSVRGDVPRALPARYRGRVSYR